MQFCLLAELDLSPLLCFVKTGLSSRNLDQVRGRLTDMAVFLLSLLLRVGFVVGSNYGYVDWAESERDAEIRAKQPIYNAPVDEHEPRYHAPPPPLLKPAAERSALAQKIEEDLPRVVTAFLHTGDSSTLRHANCSRRYELSSLRASSSATPHSSLRGVLDTVAHAATFLGVILQANRSRQHSLRRDVEWYHALLTSVVEGDPKIQRAVVTVGSEAPASGPSIHLQARRTARGVALEDLSDAARHHLKNRTAETKWFSEIRERKKPRLHRRVISPEKGSGDSYLLDKTEIKWSAPYLECEDGRFIPQWLLTLSAAFYGLKANQASDFRGVVRVDVSLQDVDINQCASSGWFAGTHRCNLTSMECLPVPGHGFVLDKYNCPCRKGFYHRNRLPFNSFKRKAEGDDRGGQDPWLGTGDCLPCREGCLYCKDDTPCHAHRDGPLRVTVIAFQGLSVFADFASMVVVYHFRKKKSIRASGLVLLESILFGALLLYFPVVILYFQPSTFRCILLRWVRLLGFAIVYGTVTLKLYRVLKVFLSRTAQRIPYMTSWRVLHLLGIILLVVSWFLVAWTLAVCQNLDRNMLLIDVGFTPDGLQFSMCMLDRWDYMMAIAESLFLLWAVYLCFAVRTVPSAFHEPRYMAVAVHNELILSAIFHIIRFTMAPGLHPDWMLMLFFAHTHLTVTVTLGLLLIPKFLFAGTHTRDDIATEAYEDELDMGRSGSYLNSSITSAWSEHSLDPEDIREELKKLYAQLEVYKRKKMLANNPHLQKKRSSKKGLGRSLMRRITEIPESVSRQCSREDKDSGDHGSNRNSICTLRRNPFDPTHSSKSKEDSSLKNKVFSLKKSHSSYDHVRDQSEGSNCSATNKIEVCANENSLLDSLMGKKLVKKKSAEKIEAESAESVPLVCKSASAHNLTADKKPLHPRTSMLQKSLSVIASAKEKTLGLAGKPQNVESYENSKDAKTNPEKEEKQQSLSQSADNKQTTSKTGIMKTQINGCQSSMCANSGKNKDVYDLSEVCPWEIDDLPMPSESKVQKHVSIAPGQTISLHGNGAKGKPQHKQKASEQFSSNIRYSSQKDGKKDSQEQEDDAENPGDGTKCPVSSFSTQLPPAGEYTKKQKAEVCPWDAEELPDKQADTGPSPDKDRGKSSAKVEEKAEGLNPDHTNPKSTARADICPWDYDSPASPSSEKTSNQTQFSKFKDSISRKKSGSSSKTLETEKEKSKEKDNEKGRSKNREGTEKQVGHSKVAQLCPLDMESSTEVSPAVKQKGTTSKLGLSQSKQADICPWDFQDVLDNKEQNKNPTTAKQSSPNSKGGLAENTKMAEVCPWDFDIQTSGKNA
ncbi:G protein-coupled receptor 158a isoform X2 [Scleropages formosus]|uniref:G protein-coupled receptor 158 n=1 Tax=Scleropages formosus TaxID=113540 RepID=A0A8C9SAB1_SCLFO|nr:probable G-protein coupled receptor 158 isoform X2 [Scleropages formosus]